MVKCKLWRINNSFVGEAKEKDFTLAEEELRPLKDGEYLSEALFWSVDPYMRSFDISHLIGGPMMGSSVNKILESKHPDYKVGDLVVGYYGWRTHVIHHGDKTSPTLNFEPYKLPDFGGLSPSLGLGMLGMPGNTAYFGFLKACRPKPGDFLVVNAAAGAVGSHVGQLAKLKGCHVIGFTGTDEKVAWLKDELKYDAAFNYKTTDITEALKKAAPDGVDCFFDNVGGEMSGKIMEQMKLHGHVCSCGSIATYNLDEDDPPLAHDVQAHIDAKHLIMEDFSSFAYKKHWFEGIAQNLQWIQEGKLKYRETIWQGFESMPKAFISMMRGGNIGKAIVKP